MPSVHAQSFLVIVLLSFVVYGDYDCICNYNVEKPVLLSAEANAQPYGYMYEFDCKPKSSVQAPSGYYAIQFDKQLAFVEIDQQIKIQTCPGSPPVQDIIPTIPAATTTTTTFEETTTAIGPETTSPQPITTRISSNFQPITTPKTTTHYPTTNRITSIPTTITISTTTTLPITTSQRPATTNTNHISTTVNGPTKEYIHWKTAANVSGTPYQYVGVGYNLLTGDPDARGQDPGLLLSRRILQLTGNPTSVQEATYTNTSNCQSERQQFLVYGSKAYQEELQQFVKSSASNVNIASASFIFNPEFEVIKTFIDNNDMAYFDIITTCKTGTVQYKSKDSDSGNFTVSREFAMDVCGLNTGNSSDKYFHFLDKWGTSIVMAAEIGTKVVDRYSVSPTEVLKQVQKLDPGLIMHEGNYKGFSSSVSIDTKTFLNSPAATQAFGSLHSSFSKYSTIYTDVHPITEAFDMKYWLSILDELNAEEKCPGNINGLVLKTIAANLENALTQYPNWRDVQSGYLHSTNPLLDRPKIQVPITWPSGTYGLMQTRQDCPSGWAQGWRKQDTEDSDSHNYYSAGINNFLAGDFNGNNIVTGFCIKTTATTSRYDEDWPPGKYCILKKGVCPSGFYSGFIFWDDEDIDNSNNAGGTLPDGEFNSNTKIYYCCRNDGSSSYPIYLPSNKPFVLVRYDSQCQAVHGMSAQDLYIRWDDEDTLGTSGSGGMHPFDEGGDTNHLLHFCYYQSNTGPSLIG